MLSKSSLDALSDLIQNRLSTMHVGDRDDLREKLALQQALAELHQQGLGGNLANNLTLIPTRGRRRKVADMLEDHT